MRIFFPNGAVRYPPTQGREVHIFQLVQNLTRRGHEVITLGDDENPSSVTYPKTKRHVASLLRSVDVIYCRVEEAPNPATQLTALPYRLLIPKSTPVVWEFNTSITKPMSGYLRRRPDEVASDVAALRNCANAVAAAVCVAPDLVRQVNDLLEIPNTTVIQNASDPELFRPNLPLPEAWTGSGAAMRVSYVASGHQAHHALDLVREIATELDRRGVPIEVHTFGEGAGQPTKSHLASLHAHGVVSYLDLPRYLAGSDVGLALYDEPVDYGSPLKLFDYLSSECVPICSEASSMRAVLDGAAAGLIGDWTAVDVVDALVDLLENPALLESMKRAGRRLVMEEYNWAKVAEKTETVLSDAVDSLSGANTSRS